MKLRHLATLAGVAGAFALPAQSPAATIPPGPGPVLICGGTVSECVYWAEHLFTLSCGRLPECPPAVAASTRT
jgi:hypothetical protein